MVDRIAVVSQKNAIREASGVAVLAAVCVAFFVGDDHLEETEDRVFAEPKRGVNDDLAGGFTDRARLYGRAKAVQLVVPIEGVVLGRNTLRRHARARLLRGFRRLPVTARGLP
jgi:hypothetical protein